MSFDSQRRRKEVGLQDSETRRLLTSKQLRLGGFFSAPRRRHLPPSPRSSPPLHHIAATAIVDGGWGGGRETGNPVHSNEDGEYIGYLD